MPLVTLIDLGWGCLVGCSARPALPSSANRPRFTYTEASHQQSPAMYIIRFISPLTSSYPSQLAILSKAQERGLLLDVAKRRPARAYAFPTAGGRKTRGETTEQIIGKSGGHPGGGVFDVLAYYLKI